MTALRPESLRVDLSTSAWGVRVNRRFAAIRLDSKHQC